jgi:hypothetical protein
MGEFQILYAITVAVSLSVAIYRLIIGGFYTVTTLEETEETTTSNLNIPIYLYLRLIVAFIPGLNLLVILDSILEIQEIKNKA